MTLRLVRTALAMASMVVAGPALAQQTLTRIDTTYSFSRTGAVELNIISGEIRVTRWDRDEIRVVATTERGTLDPTYSGSRLQLQVRSVDRRAGPTRYDITVPSGVSVAARAVSGSIIVQETGGELDLNTVSGSIEATDGRGRVEAGTVSGRITLRRVSGRVDVSTVSGSVDIDEVSGDLELKTVSGRVRAGRANLESLRHKSVSGGFELTGSLGANGRSTIETHSGSVSLRVPEAFKATVDMESWSGELNSDFQVTLQPGNYQARGAQRRLSVAVNGGGARLSIKTFSGDIFLRKNAASREEN